MAGRHSAKLSRVTSMTVICNPCIIVLVVFKGKGMKNNVPFAADRIVENQFERVKNNMMIFFNLFSAFQREEHSAGANRSACRAHRHLP